MKTFESAAKRSAGSDIKWTPDTRQHKQPVHLSISEHANDPHWALVQRIVEDIRQSQQRMEKLQPEYDRLFRQRRNLAWPQRQRRYQIGDDMAALQRELEEAMDARSGQGRGGWIRRA